MQAILVIKPPTGVKQLRHFLGMVQYYRDLWARRSDMLAPLTSLFGECGQTKTTKPKGTKRVPWHWDEVHQRAFNHVKATIAKDVVLAYPDYSKVFEIYTDASSKQLDAVITQDNRPIAFFRLSNAQCKYSITKIELLAIVKTLKEFRGMLWGQNIKVFTDHANHERCSRLNLRPSVPMEVIAGRVRAQDCLYKRHTQYSRRCSLTARV